MNILCCSALKKEVVTYNTIRPQLSLEGNTPAETFAGKPVDMNAYKAHFSEQKSIRVIQNQQNSCKSCKTKENRIPELLRN